MEELLPLEPPEPLAAEVELDPAPEVAVLVVAAALGALNAPLLPDSMIRWSRAILVTVCDVECVT